MDVIKTRQITMSLKEDITALVEMYGKYAWILHDMDIDTDTGEVKDAHYHYYIEFPNPRHLASVAKEFGVPENMIEVVRNKTGVLRYLTHSTESSKEKYHYDDDRVHSSFNLESEMTDMTMQDIYKVFSDGTNLYDVLGELSKRGLKGNPLSNLNYAINIWSKLLDRSNPPIR